MTQARAKPASAGTRNASASVRKPKPAERPRTGARGALLDEYERALRELRGIVQQLDEEEMAFELRPAEPDPNCRSIGSILEHVVRAGYRYPTFIRRKRSGDPRLPVPRRVGPATPAGIREGLEAMFAYTVETLAEVGEREMMQKPLARLVVTPWGQRFDYDQLMEHAIVHVLRHRRQIERYRREIAERRSAARGSRRDARPHA